MIMFSTKNAVRFEELNQILSNPTQELYQDPQKIKALNREYTTLSKIKDISETILKFEKVFQDNLILINNESDIDFIEMAKLENLDIDAKLPELRLELEELERPKDPKDFGNCIIEIRAGTGGEEASLFASDLHRMYSRFAITKGFQIELLDQTFASAGGIKEIIFQINGDEAYGTFKNESGVHRVQRIPATENAGRIHTSAASVVVLPIVTSVDIVIRDQDIRIDVYRSSGPGGQSVNTTDSAVRITHAPSGIVVTCQDGKSQLKNKESALSVLRSKLYDIQQEKLTGDITDIRRTAIKAGDRSDKIKTYNYPQNRITDHRVKQSWYKLSTAMEGDIEDILKVDLNKVGDEDIEE